MDEVAGWHGVTRRYRSVNAVRDLTLSLHQGELVALVGHNGAGKTTLIKLLLGLIRPDAGTVRVGGLDPAGPRGAQARRHVGFVPENVAFHAAMSARELLDFYARLKGEPRSRNAGLLERVGLAAAADRRVGGYSKGMRQRLGIAQALIGAPTLLVLDEPTSGLDPATRSEVYTMLGALRERGATVLMSTHALDEIEQRADRIAVMHAGRLLAAEPLAALRAGSAWPLRLTLTVRECSTARLLAVLPPAVRCLERGPTRLVLQLPAALKMGVLRALAAVDDAVQDLDVEAAGLGALHDQLVKAAEGAP